MWDVVVTSRWTRGGCHRQRLVSRNKKEKKKKKTYLEVVVRKHLKDLFEGAALAALQIETPLRLAFRAREGVGGWKTLRVVFSGGGGGGVREVAA
jgi:hypothetical protein